ncbi:MAG: 1-(5-phosphoribosyl)-5-[(5-phosphoribosylamino)methylideneamino]imidazole-4-carboxamide isomerase [Candidatus Dormibacteria bacterium]
MLVIPAIDLLGGRVVRLRQGAYDEVTDYPGDPVTVAIDFAAAGAGRIHVVDLDAARGRPPSLAVIRAIVAATSAEVEVGGGVRDSEAAASLFSIGVRYVVLGTLAAENPAAAAQIARAWPDRVFVGIDARGTEVQTRGWVEGSGSTITEVLAPFEDVPLAGIIHTEVSRDGMLAGPDLAALAQVITATRHPVVASGGVAELADLGALRVAGAAGAIVGKAIYEGRFSLEEALRSCP